MGCEDCAPDRGYAATGDHRSIGGFDRPPAGPRGVAGNREFETQATVAITTLDHWLAERPFVAGPSFSMADLPAGALMHCYFGMAIDHPRTPHVHTWRERLTERKPYRAHTMTPFDDLSARLAF